MDKIKKFITCLVPVHACNFRCSYCYLSHHPEDNAYGRGIKNFVEPPERITKFFSIERTEGICYFNLCAAGETMLHPQLIELVSELTKQGHYVDIVTNGTISKAIDNLTIQLNDDQKKHLFIKFSFHYLELISRKMLDQYIDNVNKIKQNGISYTIEITPHDELIPYIDEIKEFSMKHFGAWPHITVARNEGTKEIELLTKLSREEYYKTWSVFDSAMFDFKFSIFNVKRCEFCNAGSWSLSVNLEDGCYDQCYGGERLGNIIDIDRPIYLHAIGKCREPHCFNGHAFLGFGDIPQIGTRMTYADERDRVMVDGNHWLQPSVLDFFSSKLIESNVELTEQEKNRAYNYNKYLHVKNFAKRVLKKIKVPK